MALVGNLRLWTVQELVSSVLLCNRKNIQDETVRNVCENFQYLDMGIFVHILSGSERLESKLRICCVCKSNYKYCPSCKEDKDKEPWHFSFCSENCKDIYNTASSFEDGRIDANIAKEQLDKLDLSKIDNFGESYRKTISKIMENSSVVNKTKNQEVDEIVENKEHDNIKQAEEVNDEVDEEKSIKKSRTRRTKNVE